MTKAKIYHLPFIKKEHIAKDTYSFYFERKNFPDFIPGQYVYITLPHKEVDDRGSSRHFTIASSPRDKKHLMITTRIIQSSFKKALLQLIPGTKVQVFGPIGWFLLPKDEKEEKVFISGGIGITPFYSLLTTLGEETFSEQITLIASFATEAHAVFKTVLQEVSTKNPQIKVIYTFLSAQEFEKRISEELLKKHIPDVTKPVYYIVGSEAMVAATKAVLLGLGIDEEKIQTEDFTGY